MSFYDLSQGFSKPILKHPGEIPQDVIDAKQTIDWKRKLTRILR